MNLIFFLKEKKENVTILSNWRRTPETPTCVGNKLIADEHNIKNNIGLF